MSLNLKMDYNLNYNNLQTSLYAFQNSAVGIPCYSVTPINERNGLGNGLHIGSGISFPCPISIKKTCQSKRNQNHLLLVARSSSSSKDKGAAQEKTQQGKNALQSDGNLSLNGIEKRRNLFELQKEIGDDFLNISPEARENLRKKKLKQRQEGLKAVYEAEAKAGTNFNLSPSEIGLKGSPTTNPDR